MKRFITFITVLVLAVVAMAQAPQKMNFQALVRDGSNELVKNKQVTVTASVTNAQNTVVYSEQQTVTTNGNGVATMLIGEGTPTKGSFASIDWASGSYYLQTSIDLGGGAAALSCISPLLSVPYALYAEKAGNATVDLSGYYSKEEVDALLAALESKIENGGGGNGGNQQGNLTTENGAIQAAFSVSDSKQVYFSQGNLQYQASTGTWRFAEHQYDMIGSDNPNISSTYSGWIDLFGWGTSGWNSGANAYQPYSTSDDDRDYYPGGSYSNDLTGSYANADWGVYNKISNGGNQTGMWRTLTYSEWNYLISGRAQANRLMGQGRVNNVNGLILLPDSWATETPSSVRFTYNPGNYSTNVYSLDEWAVMQSYGAVFLPAAGYRNGTYVNYVGSSAKYCSSSANHYYNEDNGYDYGAVILRFGDAHVHMQSDDRNAGQSVRLVKNVE